MANALYRLGAKKIADADIDLLGGTIKAALVKSAYTVNLTTHEFYTDLGANVLDTPVTLANPTTTLGVFDADDVVFAAVTAGDTASFVVLYRDTGDAATSPLIAYFDTISNFPATTNGGDITVEWSSGASKIFAL